MGKLNSNHFNFEESEPIKEAFLLEALGHFSACDITAPANRKIVLPKGSLISPHTIGYLASMGIDRIPIYHKPRVSIIVISQGLLSPGDPAKPGKTYDSGTPMLRAALEDMRIRPVFIRRLMNEPKLLRRLIPFALNQSDLVILMFHEMKPEIQWIREILKNHKIQLIVPTEEKRPYTLEKIGDNKLVFCLPYNAEYIFDYFYKYIRPMILLFMGRSATA